MKRYFDHLHTLSEIKAEYKRLVKLNHPDIGGDTATMQEINAQYSAAVEHIAKYGEGRDQREAAQEVPAEYMAAVAAAVNLAGAVVELVGSWIWVTGNTYAHKSALKAAGYMWASRKKAWYWHPIEAACISSGKKTLNQIRAKYGSERLTAANAARMAIA